MRLSLIAKLTLGLTLGTTLVLAVYGWLTIQRERSLFSEAKREYGEVLAHSLARQMAENWRLRGKPTALELLDHFDTRHREISIRWISFAHAPHADYAPHLTPERLGLLRAGETVTVEKRSHGSGVLAVHTYVPVPHDNENPGAVEVIESVKDRAVYTTDSIWRLVVTFLVLVGVAAALALVLSVWLVGRPIRALISATERIGQGDLEARAKLSQTDELGKLGQALGDMAGRIRRANLELERETQERRRAEANLRHAERLTTVGKLAAGVAHEIGTPLNVISGRGKRVARRHDDSDTAKDLAIIQEQVDRVTKIVRNLLDFARGREPDRRAVDVSSVLEETVELLESTARKHSGVSLTLRPPPGQPLVIDADALQLQQVLSNLVLNAAQAMPQGGQVVLGAEIHHGRPSQAPEDFSSGPWVRIFVRDEGEGVSEELRHRIFEPFFTTKDVGEGTGLGLSVVYGIVKDHGGWIEAGPNPDSAHGACFSVFLPMAQRGMAVA